MTVVSFIANVAEDAMPEDEAACQQPENRFVFTVLQWIISRLVFPSLARCD